MGRPSKLTPDLAADLCERVERGVPLDTAAAQVGIAPSTMRRWRQSDDEFSAALARARANWEAGLLAKIQDPNTEPRHAAHLAWLLERRYPQRYARRDRPEVTVRDQSKRLAQQPDAERIAELEALTAELKARQQH